MSNSSEKIPITAFSYMANSKTKEIHKSWCIHAKRIQEGNREAVLTWDLRPLFESGYNGCTYCFERFDLDTKPISLPTYMQQFVDQYPNYIVNRSTKEIHIPSCSWVNKIKEANKMTYTSSESQTLAVRRFRKTACSSS